MKATISNISKRRIIKPSKTEGIINCDVDNAYFQRVVDVINASGTGTLVTKMMGKFIFGEGFSDKDLAKLIINSKGQKANEVLLKEAISVSFFFGAAFHINYNANLDKSEINFIPFEDARFTTIKHDKHPKKIAVYNDWEKANSSRIKQSEVDYFDFYNPDPEVIKKQVIEAGGFDKYKGQILYWTPSGGIATPGDAEYPLAPSDSVLEEIQTDYQTKIFKFRNITTNFMASQILESEAFETEEERTAFEKVLESFQGADETSKILLLEKQPGQEESGFKLVPVEIQDIDKLYKQTEESSRDNIIRSYLIPPVLLMKASGGFSDSEMSDAVALYNGQTSEYRIALSALFEELLAGFKGTAFTDYSIELKKADTVKIKDTAEGKAKIVDVLSNPALSDKQKKRILVSIYELSEEDAAKLLPIVIEGQEPEALDEGAKAKATLRGSVGGVTGILSIQEKVSNGAISRSGALAILEIIYGLSQEEANRVIGESIPVVK